MKLKQVFQLIFFISAISLLGNAQILASHNKFIDVKDFISLTGTVLELDTEEPLIGASVVVVGTNIGTITDINGNFSLSVERLPASLEVSFIGYETSLVEVSSANTNNVLIRLKEDAYSLDQVIVSASKYEQRLVTTPVTVEKLSAEQLINSPTADFYEAFSSMRGVQANTGSMVFTSFNTRGFGDPNNLRFIQHLDGMDITTPGFGIVGNTAGATSLDIAGMELLPGASSALYGPDAFNGILLMYTKDPFKSPGFSLDLKTGFTRNGNGDNNAYNDWSARYVHLFSKKLALKIDANHRRGQDWIGTDFTRRIRGDAEFNNRAELLRTTRDNAPAFNAVNRYGDGDFGVGVIGGVELTNPSGAIETATITRTGLTDQDVFDGKMRNYRLNTSLYYQFNNDWQASITQKIAHNDFSFRITTFYPFEDFEQTHTKFEIKGPNLNVRAYRSGQKTNKTYVGFLMARTVENSLKSDGDWIADYKEEYAKTGNHINARSFADRDLYGEDGRIIESRKNEYESLRERYIKSTNPGEGGGGFLDNSSFTHFDIDYDFGQAIQAFRLQMGANVRRYNVDSDGTFFNDHRANGITGAINFLQYGAFAQVSKNMLNDQFTFTGSLRYDKNENFEGNVTPRVALTYGLDKERNHNLRISYQTAFRNPGLQESFINFDLFSFLKILGTNAQSLDNFVYTGASGTSYTFDDIVPNAAPLKPEKNTTYEIGYRGLFNNKLLVDVNGYLTQIPNFIFLPTYVFKPGEQDFKVFLAYKNSLQDVTTYGFGLSFDYDLGKGYRAGANYNHNELSIDNYKPELEGGQSEDNFIRTLRFNMPRHRFNVSLGNTGFGQKKNLSFNVAFRITSSYDYESAFGATVIPSINNTDISFAYAIPASDLKLSLNITNLFGQDFSYVYGGGTIGSIYTLGLRYTPDGK